MLTAEAISALLRAEEGETLAFQERFGADVIETAVAFANTHGGTILMGVRDEAQTIGEHCGKEALRDYVNRHATATEPAVVLAPYRVVLCAVEVVALQISDVSLKPVARPVIARSAATKQSSNGRGTGRPPGSPLSARKDNNRRRPVHAPSAGTEQPEKQMPKWSIAL